MKWVSERRFLHFIDDIKQIFANKNEIPKKLSELENDIGAGVGDGGNFEEKDPTVPSWAKSPTKPKYTASEVGALPNTTKIPSKTSDLQNDSGFLTEHQDLSGYALKIEVPKSAIDVGADVSGTASLKVSEHNINSNAHNDIRLLISALTERLNTLADSDDTTLDQMSEIVAYIKSNKALIDAITTSKVNVSDIVNDLSTNVSNRPLSAAQGVALKLLIDGIIVPSKLSDLSDDATHRTVTDIEKETWNNKLNQSDLQSAVNTALLQAKESGEFNGADGYTPVKGTDYYTDADKTEIVNLVLAALPSAEGVSY